MTLQAGGYSVEVENVNGWAFLHSFKGKGKELKRFVSCVLGSLECPAMVTAKGTKARFYARLGFVDTGEETNGNKVMVRF